MSLLDLVFPKHCVSCGRAGNYFCPKCLTTIKRVRQICPVCERPTPFGQTHTFCRTRNSLDGLISLFTYEGIIRGAIHKLKYKFVTDLESEFWKIIQSSLEKRGEEILVLKRFISSESNLFIAEEKPVIVPIPLYWYKEHFRGFNQSSLFGKRLASCFSLSFSDKILVRARSVPSQTKLTQGERMENVKGIFRISPNILISQYHNILLVDDVWTTGATMKEATKTLKIAGVKTVWGLTVAR